MDTKLFMQGIGKFVSGIVLIGLLLFLPAGTFAYWQAWLLIGILFIPMFVAGLIMIKKSPELLQKRLNVKEEQTEQKTVIALSGVMFLAAFVTAGLNIRFGWMMLPAWVSYAAAVVFLLAYALYAEVLRRPGLAEAARERHRVVIAGPSTLAALLSSLSLGFRTLSIEQRTGEVWQLLGTLRGEFARFGETLERMRQRLDQATGELDTATARSRAITRRLDELDRYE